MEVLLGYFLNNIEVETQMSTSGSILPFPVDDLEYLTLSIGKNVLWEERYVKPYADDIDAVYTLISRQPI